MGINVYLKAGKDTSDSVVMADGQIIEPINQANIDAFGIQSGRLSAMATSVYAPLLQPIFFNYQDITTTLEVTGAEILGITSEPIIVKTQEFYNSSSVPGTFNVAISDTVSDTVTNSWNTGGSLTISQKIEYGLDFILSGKGETSITYTQSWGVGGSTSRQYTVGSNSGVTVVLEPGQKVVAELSASRGILRAQVNYNAYISGSFGLNLPTYIPKLGGYVSSIPAQKLMSDFGIPNGVPSSEIIEVGYYSNSRVEISDIQGKTLATHFV